MFIVIKTDQDQNEVTESAIGFIYEKDKFLNFVQQIEGNGAKYIKEITQDDLRNEEYDDGLYYIDCADGIALINKYRTISKGFFYNSTHIHVEQVAEWKYIPFNGDKDKDRVENMNNNKTFELEKTFLDYTLLENDDIKKNSLIGIIGKTGSGKTILVESILSAQSKEFLENTLIITPKDNFYKSRHPNLRILRNFDHRVVKEYLGKSDGCIVLDDIHIPKRLRGTTWEDLFFTTNKMRIITVQKSVNFHPKIKRRMDYTFYLKETNDKELNKIWNHLGKKSFDDIKEFKDMIDQMTENHGAMVFERNNNNHNLFRYNAIYKIKLE